VFCRSLFVLLYFFFSPLCCLSFFDIRILITPLVSSNSSYSYTNACYLYLIEINKHPTQKRRSVTMVCFSLVHFVLKLYRYIRHLHFTQDLRYWIPRRHKLTTFYLWNVFLITVVWRMLSWLRSFGLLLFPLICPVHKYCISE
jgi:hypothetical protein